MARLRARCSTAALDAAYEYAPDSPSEPVAMPATEPVIMTREVSATEAFFDKRGVNLEEVSICKRREGRSSILLNRKEHALHVQIHDLIPTILLVYFLEFAAPGRARVREKNVNVVGVLFNFLDQSLDLRDFGAIGGDRDGFAFAWQSIESCDSIVACAGFAGCDEDLGTACLEESASSD